MDVQAAQRKISDKQFMEWLAFIRLEDPEWKADYRSGTITAAIVNSNRAKDSDPVAKTSDYMLAKPAWLKDEADTQKISDPDQIETMLKARVRASQAMQKRLGPAFDGHIREAERSTD